MGLFEKQGMLSLKKGAKTGAFFKTPFSLDKLITVSNITQRR